MKLKLDENLPALLTVELRSPGHDVDTVPEENLAGQVNAEVWSATQAAQRFLITQDLDFSDGRGFRSGTHGGLLLVRLPDAGQMELIERVVEVFSREDMDAWRSCLVVLSGHKLRVLRPEGVQH